MRIVHWNTHHGGKRTDGVLDTAGFGVALLALRPDVVCLNEVEQFNGYGHHDAVGLWIAALGPGWSGYFANLSGAIGGPGQGNAILARTALVTGPLSVKTLYKQRVALALPVEHYTIVATHLDAERQADRIVEIVDLFTWMPLRVAAPLIVCADWNAAPTSVELAPCRAYLHDTWAACVAAKTATSWNGTGNTKGSRIDAIYTRGVSASACDVPDTRDAHGVFPSDHSPIVATFA